MQGIKSKIRKKASKKSKTVQVAKPARKVESRTGKLNTGKLNNARKTNAREPKTKQSTEKFKIGDYLVYPMHGVGKVASVAKQEVLGKSRRYYVLEIDTSRMRVFIPTDKVKESGVRAIIGEKEVKKVLRILKKDDRDLEEDWKLRYQNNLLKIKSGDIYSVAEVCRNLSKRNQDKELSLMERRLYESAYNLVTSEIACSADLSKEDAGNLISEILD